VGPTRAMTNGKALLINASGDRSSDMALFKELNHSQTFHLQKVV